MGHSSIKITVDTYGHMIPGADVSYIDRLDSPQTSPQQSATRTQPGARYLGRRSSQITEKNGAPGGIRTPDLQIRSLPLYPSELQARALESIR